MKQITLKNAELCRTIEVTYDGFNFNAKHIQHGALLVVKSTYETELGEADAAIANILQDMNVNGYHVYGTDGEHLTTIREVVHAVDELEAEQ